MTSRRYLIFWGVRVKPIVAKAHTANAMENAKQKEAATTAVSARASGGPLVGMEAIAAARNVDMAK